MEFTKAEIAKMMDQAVLKPDQTDADIQKNAELCKQMGIGNLCVRPTDVAYAKSLLEGSGTAVSCVIGFPHGAARSETKALEGRLAIEDGAQELDMVMNIGKLKSGGKDYVREDIEAVVQVAHQLGAKVKVILETCLLTPDEIRRACELSVEAGADFVKTSTGFNGRGATPEAVRIMLDAIKGRAKVKASGGIRTWDAAVSYAQMGVARLGVSGGPRILSEKED